MRGYSRPWGLRSPRSWVAAPMRAQCLPLWAPSIVSLELH